MNYTPELEKLVEAAKNMDWEQVVLNGGPPCFFLEEEGRFCGRAQRWFGHTDKNEFPEHVFINLETLLAFWLSAFVKLVREEAEKTAYRYNPGFKPNTLDAGTAFNSLVERFGLEK